MKKLLLILFAVVFAFGFLTSCEKEPDPVVINVDLQVNLVSYKDFVDPDTGNKWRWFEYKYEIVVTGGIGFTINVDYGNGSKSPQMRAWPSGKVFSGSCYYIGAGLYTFSVQAIDIDGNIGTISKEIRAK